MPLIGHGPFPPTPENVYKAIMLGIITGAVLAIIIDRYFKKRLESEGVGG